MKKLKIHIYIPTGKTKTVLDSSVVPPSEGQTLFRHPNIRLL